MLNKFLKIGLKFVLFSMITNFSILLISLIITRHYAKSRTFSIQSISPAPIAIVFGAGLWRDGSPTPVLRDRIKTAADLYTSGKVDKLLMSGDNRFVDYNEPEAMLKYALELGVPKEDIILDYAGRRTYDTCYRAIEIFGVTQAILVTQNFHLPRALYTCNILGLESRGVPADQRQYHRRSLAYWYIRETFAIMVALWDVHISRPIPILGKPEPIFTTNRPGLLPGGFS